LEDICEGLNGTTQLLKPGGRFVTISFHSLEDKLVKEFLTLSSKDEEAPTFSFVNKRVIAPSEEEVKENPRSRTARMRIGLRTEHSPAVINLSHILASPY